MTISNAFTQNCPTCGRQLRIHIEFIDERVCCKHCQADFVACDPNHPRSNGDCWRSCLLEKADELLELTAS